MEFSFVFPLTMATQTGMRVTDIVMRVGKLMNLTWSSGYLVTDGTTLLPKEHFTSETDTSSYLNIDPQYTKLVRRMALEKIFTTHIDDPDSRGFFMAKNQATDQSLTSRFPSRREPVTTKYAERPDPDFI
jgi:hypothetical protein